ncbi:CesT family type III secretion system chaperone [Pseudomonas fluorescens]|uniref:CesT family type III secretion system chaperone n=1 Tax=Pseudomonas fluorescens TaxID=294 RepID=UPI001BECD3A1|nr:CesT family type III secretion system chaperone [Pseudomonas fluorescens]MBT2374284.1 CesT family type III secretion system chaperone [Pseudomonas fluorescens]
MKKHDDFLQRFGLKLGLSDLTFDRYRMCQLRVEGLKFAVYDNRARGGITILCELSGPSMNSAEVESWRNFLFETQFDFLHKDTAVVGLNSASGAMVAMSHVLDEDVSVQLLSEELSGLIDWVMDCSRRFSMSYPPVVSKSLYPSHKLSHGLASYHNA